MKKLAIVIDSFSGYTQDEIEKNNNDIYFLPLQMEMDNKTFLEGIDDCSSVLEELINPTRKTFKTSLPPIYLIEELIENLSKKYENVIFLNIPSYLSSTYSYLEKFSENKKNINVIDTHLVGDQYLLVANQALKMSNEGANLNQIIKFIKQKNGSSIGYIIPDDLTAFIQGGRLSGIKKFVAKKFFLLVKVYDTLKVGGISRTFNGAVKKGIEKFEKFIEDNHWKKEDFELKIVYAFNEKTKQMLLNALTKYNSFPLKLVSLSSISTGIHTGYGAVYFGIEKK